MAARGVKRIVMRGVWTTKEFLRIEDEEGGFATNIMCVPYELLPGGIA